METGLPDLQNFTLTVLKSYFEKLCLRNIHRDFKNFSNNLFKELSENNANANEFELF